MRMINLISASTVEPSLTGVCSNAIQAMLALVAMVLVYQSLLVSPIAPRYPTERRYREKHLNALDRSGAA